MNPEIEAIKSNFIQNFVFPFISQMKNWDDEETFNIPEDLR